MPSLKNSLDQHVRSLEEKRNQLSQELLVTFDKSLSDPEQISKLIERMRDLNS